MSRPQFVDNLWQNVPYPGYYRANMLLQWVSATQINVVLPSVAGQAVVGVARDGSDSVNINLTNVLSVSTSSANYGQIGGLDTGVIANSTWYNVCVVTNSAIVDGSRALPPFSSPTPPGAMLTLQTNDAPSMPGQYDTSIIIGSILTDSDGNIRKFYNPSKGLFIWDLPINVYDTGVNTGYVAVDCATACPLYTSEAILNVTYTADTAANSIYIQYNGSTSGLTQATLQSPSTDEMTFAPFNQIVDSTQKFQIKNTSASDEVNVNVTGYVQVI
jgi:hypothetical protein